MEVRLLKPEEHFEANLISTVAFHMKMEDPAKNREESLQSTDEDWGAFSEDGKIMARIINNHYTTRLDGQLISNGGIGAVSTLPEYRNTGAVRAIFDKLIPEAYSRGEIISTLYPFNHAFYRKFGYETVRWLDHYEFAPAVLSGYRFSGDAELWKTGDPVSEYTALYNRFADSFNLAMVRDDKMMLDLIKGEYYKDRKFSYLLHENGKTVAYLIFQDVRNDPAQRLLEIIKKPDDSCFVIRVEGDAQISENNGTWEVSGKGAVPTEKAPDLTVSIQALGQMAAGAVSLFEAMYRPDVTVSGNEAVLEKVFVRKPILVEDHF